MFFKATIGDRTFELPKLTLGDTRYLKKYFGLDDFTEFSPMDPDQLVGILALCLRRDNAALTHDEAVAEAESIDIEDFLSSDDEGDDEPDPTPGADGAQHDAGASKPATRRKKPGARS